MLILSVEYSERDHWSGNSATVLFTDGSIEAGWEEPLLRKWYRLFS